MNKYIKLFIGYWLAKGLLRWGMMLLPVLYIAYQGAFSSSDETEEAVEVSTESYPEARPQELLEAMDKAEFRYYEQVLTYAMETLEAGANYNWKTYGSSGVLQAEAAFTSPSDAVCRHVTEHLVVRGYQSTSQWVACRRPGDDGQGGDGWCRLLPSYAYTCVFESDYDDDIETAAGDVLQSVRNKWSGVDDTIDEAETIEGEIVGEVTGTAGNVIRRAQSNWNTSK